MQKAKRAATTHSDSDSLEAQLHIGNLAKVIVCANDLEHNSWWPLNEELLNSNVALAYSIFQILLVNVGNYEVTCVHAHMWRD